LNPPRNNGGGGYTKFIISQASSRGTADFVLLLCPSVCPSVCVTGMLMRPQAKCEAEAKLCEAKAEARDAILTTTCRQILCHRRLRFIHDQILMIYHEANLSENEARIVQGQTRGRGQILRGRGQKNWHRGREAVLASRAGLEHLTSLVCEQSISKSYEWLLMKFYGEVGHGPRMN